MLITRNLDTEFRTVQAAERLRALGSIITEGTPYSYLPPGYTRVPQIGGTPTPRRVGFIANAGGNSVDSSYLTEVEKRAITRYAGRITYTEPEMMGPLFDPINWYLPWIRFAASFSDRGVNNLGNCKKVSQRQLAAEPPLSEGEGSQTETLRAIARSAPGSSIRRVGDTVGSV